MNPARVLLAVIFLTCTSLPAGDELVCRGFPATDAVAAVSSHLGIVLPMGPELDERKPRSLWFALPDRNADAARQALAHSLGCWWSAGGLVGSRRLLQTAVEVRTYPALPVTLPGAERLVRQALDPWLGGNGGLAQDFLAGTWSMTAPTAAQARLESLLAALGDPHPRAPHLLADPLAPSPGLRLAHPPGGVDLASWCIDLMRASGLAVALGSDVDPLSRAPDVPCTTLGEAQAAILRSGLQIGIWHRCLVVSAAAPLDRRHPAERAALAILPADHLCHDADELGRFAAQLGARVRPADWELPGWMIAPLPTRLDLLVLAEPATIHAVMEAMEAADQAGLQAWLR